MQIGLPKLPPPLIPKEVQRYWVELSTSILYSNMDLGTNKVINSVVRKLVS